MMAFKVTPVAEEEGAEVEGAKKEGGTIEVGSSVSVSGYFDRSWALLRQTESALMAPMVVK